MHTEGFDNLGAKEEIHTHSRNASVLTLEIDLIVTMHRKTLGPKLMFAHW